MLYIIDSIKDKKISYHTESPSWCTDDRIQAEGDAADKLFNGSTFLLKIEDGKPVWKTDEDIAVKAAQATQSTQLDEIQAQVLYTALVTDSLLGSEKE